MSCVTLALSKYDSFRGAAPNFRKLSDSPEVQRIQNRETAGRDETARKIRYEVTVANLPWLWAVGSWASGRRDGFDVCRGAEGTGALWQTTPTASASVDCFCPSMRAYNVPGTWPYDGERLRSLISLVGVVLLIEGRRRFGLRYPTSSQRHGVDESEHRGGS